MPRPNHNRQYSPMEMHGLIWSDTPCRNKYTKILFWMLWEANTTFMKIQIPLNLRVAGRVVTIQLDALSTNTIGPMRINSRRGSLDTFYWYDIFINFFLHKCSLFAAWWVIMLLILSHKYIYQIFLAHQPFFLDLCFCASKANFWSTSMRMNHRISFEAKLKGMVIE